MSSSSGSANREQLLAEAIQAIYQARDAGLGSELREFLADLHVADGWLGPIREVSQHTPRPGETPNPGKRTPGDESDPPGSLGDYEVIRELGKGGMGIVYLARQKRLGRTVALKVMRRGVGLSDDEIQRFLNESRVISELDHPQIVPVYGAGQAGDTLYYSMKYLEGGTLAQLLADPGRKPGEHCRETARMVAMVARAVHHAHQHGILHRDLKPSNVLLDRAGQPHVTDFGLAKRVGGANEAGIVTEASLTHTGMIVGSPYYTSRGQE